MNVLSNLNLNNQVTSNAIDIKHYIKKFFLLFGFVKSDSGNFYFYVLRNLFTYLKSIDVFCLLASLNA